MPAGPFVDALTALTPLDAAAAAAAAEHLDRLTKPPGSLGRLESLAVQLAAIAGEDPPPLPRPAAVAVFAGDHGVHAEGVTPWPQEVTGQMVANFCAGGAAINVLARLAGASVVVVDVGVATSIPDVLDARAELVRARVAPGTANLATGPAMTAAQVSEALDVGAALAARLVSDGARCLVTGDMGIANTTPSAALIAAFTGQPAAEVTGRGTGIDDVRLARKTAVVAEAVARIGPSQSPADILAELGGLEIAALAGFMIGGAAARVPVVIDGVIAAAAALAAAAFAPEAIGYLVAGHRSAEPGATTALAFLGLEPLLDLGLRLGEGTGACLALVLVESAARILREMATFDSAGVTEK